ncbi:UBX domain-containing protein 10 [Leucoagaricus sp. SymC.cos]|nr:UBX domain-containing protein 10 [Leucoagaricus sp. SymC.cos]
MSNLTDSQRRALDQLRELTNGGSDEVSIGVLESVDWNVERAAEAIFGGGPSPSNSPPTPPPAPKTPMETFEVDDSAQNRNQNTGGSSIIYTFTRPIFSLLAVPLHILGSVFRFIFNILRIPVPQFRFSTLNFYRPLRPRPTHRGGPDKWVVELEEELGAVCIGRLRGPRGSASTSGVEAGPSRLTARNTQPDDPAEGKKLLPDFIISSYEEFLRTCQRELKVGCIILITEEHDDTTEFKRATLTNSDFVKALYNNNILVWGGDVRDIEAWNASEKLQATTYPFIAFVALQPRRTPPSSSSRLSNSQQPVLTVLSRHQGRPYPSGTGPTSTQAILDHLDRQLLPRVSPFLERLRAEQRERERDRRLREEQDRAFQEAARRDKERIEARIAVERAEAEAKRRTEEEARATAIKREQEIAAAKRREELRMNWRRWTRKTIAEPLSKTNGSLRIAIRLTTGTRLVQSFAPATSLTALYAYVDSQLIPSHFEPHDDPSTPPEDSATGEQAIEAQIHATGSAADWWGFQLATAYPRSEIPWKSGVQLGDLSVLKGGGQVVVEMLGSPHSSTERNNGRGSGGDSDDDDYKTESDEE